MLELEIGKRFSLWPEITKNFKGEDHVMLSMSNTGDLLAVLFFNKPTAEEVEAITEGNASIRFFQKSFLISPMINFEKSNLIIYFYFDPKAYPDQRVLEIINKDIMITTVIVDTSENMIVKGSRLSSFPRKFSELVVPFWKHVFALETYSEVYHNWYMDLQNMPIERMWELATPVGNLGEL